MVIIQATLLFLASQVRRGDRVAGVARCGAPAVRRGKTNAASTRGGRQDHFLASVSNFLRLRMLFIDHPVAPNDNAGSAEHQDPPIIYYRDVQFIIF